MSILNFKTKLITKQKQVHSIHDERLAGDLYVQKYNVT